MTTTESFRRGLHDLGQGCWAWLQPPGGWGYANSGIVVGDGAALVVDTQNDMPMSADLAADVDRAAAGTAVSDVVNTHADGDHWNGNLRFPGARIWASDATLDEMRTMWLDPARLGELADDQTAFGRFVTWRTEHFDYRDWTAVLPTHTFSETTTLRVGGRDVNLTQVGPAHTRGDTVVAVPDAGVVFAGDVLFTASTPIMWAGPLERCVAACDQILALEPRVVVPGHGPLVDATGVAEVRDYLTYVATEANRAYEHGIDPAQAYRSLDLERWRAWRHLSRTYVNVLAVYRQRDPQRFTVPPPQALEVVLAEDDGDWLHQLSHAHHGW